MTFNFHNTTGFIGHNATLILARLRARFNTGHSENASDIQGRGDILLATPGVYALLAGVPTDLMHH